MRPQRKSPRLQGYNYAQSGAYFVTLCTAQRQVLFGEVTDQGVMVLSGAGEIAARYWYTLPEHVPEVELDVFVVMPNHLHGVLVIGDGGHGGGHGSAVSLREAFGQPMAGSLSTIMRSYKSIVTRTIHEMDGTSLPVWQGRFYDHIVRDEDDLDRIREYIINNPARWHKDTLHSPA